MPETDDAAVKALHEAIRKVAPLLFPGATSVWIAAEWPGGGASRRSRLIVPLDAVASSGATTARDAILQVLGQLKSGEGLSGKEVSSRTGYSSVWKVLAKLVDRGEVVHGPDGYALAQPRPSREGRSREDGKV